MSATQAERARRRLEDEAQRLGFETSRPSNAHRQALVLMLPRTGYLVLVEVVSEVTPAAERTRYALIRAGERATVLRPSEIDRFVADLADIAHTMPAVDDEMVS